MKSLNMSFGKLLGQAIVYGGFALVIGYLATSPSYTYFDSSKSVILVSFAHAGKAAGGCRKRTSKELAKLAPNMRKKFICSRERVPLLFEMSIDGTQVYHGKLMPTGLRSDGPSKTYQKFTVAPGRHTLLLKLRDSDRTDGFDYMREASIDLKPRQNFTIDFKASRGGFRFE